jgi:hypothetical protein
MLSVGMKPSPLLEVRYRSASSSAHGTAYPPVVAVMLPFNVIQGRAWKPSGFRSCGGFVSKKASVAQNKSNRLTALAYSVLPFDG